MAKESIGTGHLIAALALTLDQHFENFLRDFERNSARIFDRIHEQYEDPPGAEDLRDAGAIARFIENEDLEHGRRRGKRHV